MRWCKLWAMATLVVIIGSLAVLTAQSTPARAQDSATRDITDARTGIRLALPSILTEEKETKWGTNWSSLDKSINIDALTYPKDKSLKSIYENLRSIRGRTYTRNDLKEDHFVLAGRASDGSSFHIEGREKDGAVKALSIVYTARLGDKGSKLTEEIVAGFDPFSEATAVATTTPPAQETAQDVKPAEPAGTAASGQDGALEAPDRHPVTVMPNLGSIGGGLGRAIFSPDGRIVATTSYEGVKLWDVTTLRPLRTLQHFAYLLDAAFLPDGKQIATAHKDGSIKLWDVATGAIAATLKPGNYWGLGSVSTDPKKAGDDPELLPVAGLWISPDGSKLVSSDYYDVQIWDLPKRRLLKSFRLEPDVEFNGFGGTIDLRLSQDGQRIGSFFRKTARQYDAASGKVLASHEHDENSLAVLLTDDVLLVAANEAGCQQMTYTLKSLSKAQGRGDVVIGKPPTCGPENGDNNEPPAVFVSPDLRRVAVSRPESGELTIVRIDDGTIERTIRIQSGASKSFIGLSPDFSLALASVDEKTSAVSAETGAFLGELKSYGEGADEAIATSRRGAVLMFPSSPGTGAQEVEARLWSLENPASRKFKYQPKEGWRIVDVANDETVALATSETGQMSFIPLSKEGSPVPIPVSGFSNIKEAQLFPDRKRAIIAAPGQTETDKDAAYIIDLGTGRTLHKMMEPKAENPEDDDRNSISTLAVAADGSKVAIGTWGGVVEIYSADTGKRLARMYEEYATFLSLSFTPDGKTILGGTRDEDVYLWNAATGKKLKSFEVTRQAGHVNVSSVAMSKDGRLVAAGLAMRAASTGDIGAEQSVKVWDAATGKLRFSLYGHEEGITAVTFTPNDRWIVSASYDGTIRYWDRETGKWMATITAAEGERWLAITEAGFFAGSPGSEDLVNVVRGLDAYSVAQFRKHLYRPDLVEQLFKGDPERKYKDAAFALNLEKVLDSGAAPQIELHPERKTEKAGETVRIAVRITNTGGGIGKDVEWRVNGVRAGSGEPSTALAGDANESYRIVTETLRVDPSKKNEIEVVAYNGAGLLAGEPYRIAIDPFGLSDAPRPRMFVLAVGVSNYDNAEWRLQHAAKDAAAFAESISQVAKGLYADVKPLVVPESEATRTGIEAAFNRIKGEVRPADVFILFVAGHGRTVQSTGTYYFLPRDLTFDNGRTVEDAIGQETWQTWLRQIAAQKSILVFDTCESSAAAGLTRGDRERETAIDRLRDATGRSVITAARQAAYEGYKGHGVLTYAILDSLSEKPGERSGEVDLLQLASHVDREVPIISRSLFGVAQRPHNKIEGNFPIGVRRAGLVAAVDTDAVPAAPTHVVIRAERVREEARPDAPGERELSAGTQVRVVEYKGEWAIVARDGVKMGYVPAAALLKLQ
ncbi:MAG: caspase family protein [Hyphomicrobium sp.]